VATLATFVVLTVAATVGGYQVRWPWLEDNGHVVSALVLLVIGILVLLRL
jgi:putative Mn2+ efflux pump MntP